MPAEAAVLSAVIGAAAHLTLNRPAVHNALDEASIAQLTEAVTKAAADPAVRVVALRGAGKSFCAGADLEWMKRMSGALPGENEADAKKLADLMAAIADCPKPVVAIVQGAVAGGGLGLIAASDIAIASDDATFQLSEVRLGLIPAVISPYLIRSLGARAAAKLTLTAERFGAAEALRLGLLHQVVAPTELQNSAADLLRRVQQAGPEAAVAAKKLFRDGATRAYDPAFAADCAKRIAERRASTEGREGIQAFLDKRLPRWQGSADKDKGQGN